MYNCWALQVCHQQLSSASACRCRCPSSVVFVACEGGGKRRDNPLSYYERLSLVALVVHGVCPNCYKFGLISCVSIKRVKGPPKNISIQLNRIKTKSVETLGFRN